MKELNEAVIVLSKCTEHHKTYGMRVQKAGRNKWFVTWAFPIKESAAKREGYDKTSVKGDITFTEEYPGCPYCGKTPVVVCSCGHLNCNHLNNGMFQCEWCGMQGQIGAYTGEGIIAGMDA